MDAWIRSGTAAKVGLGIVNGDGTNQTKTRRIPAGRSVTFTIGASRHGSGTGTVEFVGSARRDEMYRLPDGTDITSDVTRGGYTVRRVENERRFGSS